MDQIDIWFEESFQERVGPLTVGPQRRARPRPSDAPSSGDVSSTSTVNWLGHLVEQHVALPPVDEVQVALQVQQRANDAVVQILQQRLDPAAFDEAAIRDFLGRYGPLKAEQITEAVDVAIELGGADQHVVTLLRAVLESVRTS